MIFYLNIFLMFIFLDGLGLIDQEQFLNVKGGFKAVDLLFFMVFCRLLILDIVIKRKKIIQKSDLVAKWIFIFIIINIFSIVHSFIGGGTSLLEVIKMARYTLLSYSIYFFIKYDIDKNHNASRYLRMIWYGGVIVTFNLLLLSVFRIDISNIFQGVVVQERDDYLFILKRVWLDAFLLPVVCFIFSINNYIHNVKDRFYNWLVVFFIGFILQGFRSYIFTVFILFGLYGLMRMMFVRNTTKKIKTQIFKILFSFLILILVFLNLDSSKNVTTFFTQTYNDLLHAEGSFGYRLQDDYFRWMVYKQNPFWGVGFIHLDSKRAQLMSITQSGRYSLYTTDSGYLDILMRYGVPGALFFLLFIFKFVWRYFNAAMNIRDISKSSILISTAIFLLVLLFTQISHGGLTGSYGIIPMIVLLAISENVIKINAKN